MPADFPWKSCFSFQTLKPLFPPSSLWQRGLVRACIVSDPPTSRDHWHSKGVGGGRQVICLFSGHTNDPFLPYVLRNPLLSLQVPDLLWNRGIDQRRSWSGTGRNPLFSSESDLRKKLKVRYWYLTWVLSLLPHMNMSHASLVSWPLVSFSNMCLEEFYKGNDTFFFLLLLNLEIEMEPINQRMVIWNKAACVYF